MRTSKNTLRFLLLVFLILANSGCLFFKRPQETLIDARWVTWANQTGFEALSEASTSSSESFILSPLHALNQKSQQFQAQGDRQGANRWLGEEATWEEQSLAIASLYESLLENRDYGVKLKFKLGPSGAFSWQSQWENISGSFEYLREDEFQMVSLPFKENRASLYIFSLNPGVDPPTWISQISREKWEAWISGLLERIGEVQIPEIKIRELSAEGTSFDLKIGENKKAKKIDVDLKDQLGTEDQFYLEIKTPCFFAIRDNRTGLILVMGWRTQSSSSN